MPLFDPTIEELKGCWGKREGCVCVRLRVCERERDKHRLELQQGLFLYVAQPGELQEGQMIILDLNCNIYFDNYSCKTVWRMSKVSLKHQTALICSLKLCLQSEARSVERMSLLAEEFSVRDLIQCQEVRNGKCGETSVNNEVKVIEVNHIPVSVAF